MVGEKNGSTGQRYKQRVLPFNMQCQEQSNWCWAAVSASVAKYYDHNTKWTQCAVANAALDRSDCCTSHGAAGACNISWYLGKALQTVGHLAGEHDGTAPYGKVSLEIDGNQPVGVRIQWIKGGGHFLAIIGYKDDPLPNPLHFYYVDDPVYGKSTVQVKMFEFNYQGFGFWNRTYYISN